LISTVTIVDIAFSLALALIIARVMGYFFDKLKQPTVIGEIIAGILLGGFGLGVLSGFTFSFFGLTISLPQLSYTSDEFRFFADLGILLLMFIIGLETSLSKLREVGKPTFFVAFGGVILPLILGSIAGALFGFSWQESILIGLMLVATSIGVTVRTLADLHVLNTNVGITVLGAAVVDDVLGIIAFALILGIYNPLQIGITITIFFLIFLYLGLKIIDKVMNLGEKINLPKSLLSISLAIFLFYSFFADRCGITGITGAFVAGLLIGQTIQSKKISDDVKVIGYSFFVPLFFVGVGASVDLTAFLVIGVFSVVVIIVGIIGKIVGCGIGAKLAGMSLRHSLQVGVGMIPRMEVALIIVSIAISRELITGDVAHQILATTIVTTIVTTLITPFLLKATFKYRF
jgi:Kef-type K+ transport system membrane component KefB